MEVQSLPAQTYQELFSRPLHAFNTVAFNQYNAQRLQLPLLCLAMQDNRRYKLGILGVMRDHVFQSPFSAPFGGFSFLQESVGVRTLEQAVEALQEYLVAHGVKRLELTLPPLFYGVSFLAKLQNVLYRQQFEVTKTDLNHSFHLPATLAQYHHLLSSSARNKLKTALTQDLEFTRCTQEAEKAQVYEVIRQNREARGFPLRMTWPQLLQTSQLLKSDFFLVRRAGIAVAAAVVFFMTPTTVYVVYWGDLPTYAAHRTMNFLTFRLAEFYIAQGVQIIDVGISTEDSQPNHGLCDFKESVGCTAYPKLSFAKNLL